MSKFLFLLICPFLALAQTNFDNIELLFQKKQFVEAEKKMTLFLKSDPNNLKAIELLGDAYGHQEKWDAAATEYYKLIEANENVAIYHFKYGGVLGMKALENKLKALSFIGDVKSSFLRSAELDKNHKETRWALVKLYMQLPGILGGSKSKSLKFAEQLEGLSKVDGYLAKGYIYEYDDEPELAEKFYKMAVKVGESITCYSKLATFYENENEHSKAIETMEHALEKHNQNTFRYQIGKISAEYNVQTQKGELALQAFLENYSSKDDISIAWAHYRLAQIYTHIKNKENALNQIDKALTELPNTKAFKKQKETILNL